MIINVVTVAFAAAAAAADDDGIVEEEEEEEDILSSVWYAIPGNYVSNYCVVSLFV